MLKKTVFLLSLLLSSVVFAKEGLLNYSAQNFFDQQDSPRLGIEIEIAGLNGEQIAQILQGRLGGIWSIYNKPEETVNKKTGERQEYSVRELHLKNSKIGDVVVKPEDNSVEDGDLVERTAKTTIFEIVTEPLVFAQVEILQKALADLKVSGALGTADGFAVAIQINVEMARGQRDQIFAHNIIQILRNYLKPSHRLSLAQEFNVPEVRKAYLGEFTPGMMRRIFDRKYQPSNEDFFFDFMYRQSLELLGFREAWSADESFVRHELRSYLEKHSFDRLLPVFKYNFVRTSAVLMYLFPQDWLSQFLIKTTWFHQYPILEFREGNSDFDVLHKVKGIVGLIQQSLRIGEIDFNSTNETFVGVVKSKKSEGRSSAAGSCQRIFLKAV